MKIRKRKNIISKIVVMSVMTVALLLTGCGGSDENADSSVKPESSDRESALKLDDGAVSADSVVIAVGETPVTYSEYKSYYYFMENQYDSLLGDEVWKQDLGTGKTIGQEAIEDVLRMIIQVKVINKEAEKQGVTLMADEKEDADYNAGKLCESLDDATIKDAMITNAGMMKIYEENKLAEKFYHVITGAVGEEMSGDEGNAYRVQLIFKKKEGTNASDVENLRQKIAASKRNFYSFAKKESDLDEIEQIVGGMDERKNLLAGIAGLKQGVVSSVIEEADGYYIANLLEKPNEKLNSAYRNDVISKRQTDAFQKQYAEWSANYDVEVSDQLLSD